MIVVKRLGIYLLAFFLVIIGLFLSFAFSFQIANSTAFGHSSNRAISFFNQIYLIGLIPVACFYFAADLITNPHNIFKPRQFRRPILIGAIITFALAFASSYLIWR